MTEIDAKRPFLELLKNRFNSGVRYKSKTWKRDTVILSKTQELARFFLNRSKHMDFNEPRPNLQRSDTQSLRERIFYLTQAEARELRISKSTLHSLRVHARSERSFRVYRKVAVKFAQATGARQTGEN